MLYTCVSLCTCWYSMLSLITGWSNELGGAAATTPLSGCWIGQLLRAIPLPLLFFSALPGSDASEISVCKMHKIGVVISSNFPT